LVIPAASKIRYTMLPLFVSVNISCFPETDRYPLYCKPLLFTHLRRLHSKQPFPSPTFISVSSNDWLLVITYYRSSILIIFFMIPVVNFFGLSYWRIASANFENHSHPCVQLTEQGPGPVGDLKWIRETQMLRRT
jgi:hypothetical protein